MRSILLIAAGVLVLVPAAAHGLTGWPAMADALTAAGAGADLSGALAVGWTWGTVGFVAFGSITILGGLRLRRGDASGIVPVRIVAACFLAFGVGAFALRDFNPHFLLFVALGGLSGAPTIGVRGRSS